MKGTVRHHPYVCAACGREIESTTSKFAGWDDNGALVRVCRAESKCGEPKKRANLINKYERSRW